MPSGRPSKKTPELCVEIAERLSRGETMADICRDDHMPHVSTVWDWQQQDVAFSQSIARARDIGEDVIANNTRLVARGVKGHSTGDVQRDKLVVDTDLKLLAKWNPKKYGERVTHSGDAKNPVAVSVVERLVMGTCEAETEDS